MPTESGQPESSSAQETKRSGDDAPATKPAEMGRAPGAMDRASIASTSAVGSPAEKTPADRALADKSLAEKALVDKALAEKSTLDTSSTEKVTALARQMPDLPTDELYNLAEELGLDRHAYSTRQHLVAAVHERRQLIASIDRDVLMELVHWGRRPVSPKASQELLAMEVVRIQNMKFHGLSQPALVALARLRGARAGNNDPIPDLIRRLKRQEGFFAKLNRKRRAMLGAIVSNMIGDTEDPAGSSTGNVPPQAGSSGTATPPPPQQRQAGIKQEIEEAGLFGGIAGRLKRSADSYVNQKLDEVEARIDRKLDEIDRRLAEWRDKEIANRIRILKITLWASVIVGIVSLIYAYIKFLIERLGAG